MTNVRVAALIRERLSRYRRLGLLIDDGPDAARRTARELYGSETLPAWWIQIRSVRCAIAALADLSAGLTARSDSQALIVFDRYLLPDCGDATRPEAWDLSQDGKKLVDSLTLLDPFLNRRVWTVFQTSHAQVNLPLEAHHQAYSTIEWLSRSSETLHVLRDSLSRAGGEKLLRYGPAEPSDWYEAIVDLANELSGRETIAESRVILLTGAGASLSPHRFSLGMPPTDELLEEAYRLSSVKGAAPMSSPPIAEGPVCACLDQPPTSAARTHPVTNFDALRRLKADGVTVSRMSYDLMTLFASSEGKRSSELGVFESALRCVMLGYDHGFLYQHWLLAQLPWHATITTNFDSFHERAALSVASSRGSIRDRHEVLRGHAFAAPEATADDPRGLFKPYGSLVSPVNLAWSYESVNARRQALINTLDVVAPVSKQNHSIVVLGHRLRDARIQEALAKRLSNYTIYWVIPEPRTEIIDSSYNEWQMAVSGGEVRKLDGTALEFAYDLYAEYRERIPRSEWA